MGIKINTRKIERIAELDDQYSSNDGETGEERKEIIEQLIEDRVDGLEKEESESADPDTVEAEQDRLAKQVFSGDAGSGSPNDEVEELGTEVAKERQRLAREIFNTG